MKRKSPPTVPIAKRLEHQTLPVTESGCWLWMGLTDAAGYGTIKIGTTMHRTHRASWTVHRGPIPRGIKVLHRCDVRCCINPDHLFLGTQTENIADMYRKGRGPNVKGIANPRAKLTEQQVQEIRTSDLTYHALAARYGVGKSMVGYIKTGKSWRHI